MMMMMMIYGENSDNNVIQASERYIMKQSPHHGVSVLHQDREE